MNGPTRVLLDTNAIVGRLNGVSHIVEAVSGRPLSASIVSVLEFRSFTGLLASDQMLFDRLPSRASVIDLGFSNRALIDEIIAIRTTKKLKLPDAIMVGTALLLAIPLVTADNQLLSSIPYLQTIAI